MPKICGQLKQFEPPIGGGVHIQNIEYEDGTRSSHRYKSRMVFPVIQVGDTTLKRAFVSNDMLGNQIARNFHLGEQACFIFYTHFLRKKVIIAMETQTQTFETVGKGLYGGLLWYGIFSPFIWVIPAMLGGMIIGMIGGKEGTALGLMGGVFYAVGMSWFSGYRYWKAWGEMKALRTEPSRLARSGATT